VATETLGDLLVKFGADVGDLRRGGELVLGVFEGIAEEAEKLGVDFEKLRAKSGTAFERMARSVAGGAEQTKRAADEAGSGLDTLIDKFEQLSGVRIPKSLFAGIGLAGLGGLAVKEAEEADGALRSLQARTGLVGQEFDRLRSSLDNVAARSPQGLGELSDALALARSRLGLTGDAAEDLVLKVDKVSRATGTEFAGNFTQAAGALAAFQVEAADVGPSLDSILTASQRSGTAFGQVAAVLQQAAPTLRAIGLNFRESAALVGNLERRGADAVSTLGALRSSIAGLAQAGVPAREGLNAIVESIRNAETETEALQIGLTAFGQRGAAALVPLFRTGAGFRDLTAAAETAGGAIARLPDPSSLLDRTKNAARAVGDALTPLGRFLSASLGAGADAVGRLARSFADLQNEVGAAVSGPIRTLSTTPLLPAGSVQQIRDARDAFEGLRTSAEENINLDLSQPLGLTADALEEVRQAGIEAKGALAEVNAEQANIGRDTAALRLQEISEGIRVSAAGIADAIAAQAQIVGPAFNEAAARAEAFRQVVAANVAQGVPFAKAIGATTRALGDYGTAAKDAASADLTSTFAAIGKAAGDSARSIDTLAARIRAARAAIAQGAKEGIDTTELEGKLAQLQGEARIDLRLGTERARAALDELRSSISSGSTPLEVEIDRARLNGELARLNQVIASLPEGEVKVRMLADKAVLEQEVANLPEPIAERTVKLKVDARSLGQTVAQVTGALGGTGIEQRFNEEMTHILQDLGHQSVEIGADLFISGSPRLPATEYVLHYLPSLFEKLQGIVAGSELTLFSTASDVLQQGADATVEDIKGAIAALKSVGDRFGETIRDQLITGSAATIANATVRNAPQSFVREELLAARQMVPLLEQLLRQVQAQAGTGDALLDQATRQTAATEATADASTATAGAVVGLSRSLAGSRYSSQLVQKEETAIRRRTGNRSFRFA
jgi:hypothetical protein